MQRTTLVGIAVLAFVPSLSSAQGTVGGMAGVVLDPDGAGLRGALVTAVAEGAAPVTAVTAQGGVFRLDQLAPGRYTVHAALESFAPSEAAIVSVVAGQVASVRLAFSKAAFHETVEVTAARDVLSVAEVRESTARDVGEAMAGMAGMTKVRKGGIANDVTLRGLGRDNINVLIDGQRVYGACPNRMDVPAFHVDFSEIESIEVPKGPLDIENQGSLGGIVNVVTRRPEPGPHGTATMVGGSAGFVNPSLTASWAGPKVSALGGYSYRASGPYRDGLGQRITEVTNYAAGQQDSTSFKVNTGWGKLFATPSPKDTFELSYTRQEAKGVLYPGLQMDAGYDNTDRIGLSYRHKSGARLFRGVRARAYATQVKHWMTDELRVSGAGTPLGWSMGTMAKTYAVGAKAEVELAGVRVGVEAVQRSWNGTTQMAKMAYAAQASIPDVLTTAGGVFASYQRVLTKELSLDLGARVDSFKTAADPSLAATNLYFAYNSTRNTQRTDTLPSGCVKLTWQPTTRFSLAAGLGHTVRVPDPSERYFALKRAGSDWVGNPNVNPTRNTGLDLRGSMRHDRGAFTASLYYESLTDWITLHNQARVNAQPGIMNTVARSYVNTNARLWGAEVEGTHALGRRLFLAGSLSFTRGVKDAIPHLNVTSRNLAEMPPVASRVSLRWDTGKVFAAAEGVFTATQNRIDTDLQETRTPGWSVLNLRLGGTWSGFRILGMLGNVFDRQYYEPLSSVRDPFKAGVVVPEPGRTFSVSVIRKF